MTWPPSAFPVNGGTHAQAEAWAADVEAEMASKVAATAVHPATGAVTTLLTRTTTSRGPMLATLASNLYSTDRNPTLFWGLNLKADGTLSQAAEPGMAYGQESYYNDGTANKKMEAYQQFTSTDGTKYFRPWFAQFDRTNNKLTSTMFAAGTIFQFMGDPTGAGVPGEQWFEVTRNNLQLYCADTTNDTVLTMNATASRAATLALGANGISQAIRFKSDPARADHASINAYNQISGGGGSQVDVIHFWASFGNASVSINVQDNSARFVVAGLANAESVIVAKAVASQTGDLFSAVDSSGNAHFSVTSAGLLKWASAGDIQTTVGAAGGASALPATPAKYLKVKDSAGTTYVIPAYAA